MACVLDELRGVGAVMASKLAAIRARGAGPEGMGAGPEGMWVELKDVGAE